MAAHDTIGDFITALRNASNAHKESYTSSFSKMKVGILEILKAEGFIKDYQQGTNKNGHKELTIHFKYVNNEPAICGIKRHSTPGCRFYYKYDAIPKILGGMGFAILTTSKGIMHDRNARKQKIGGELIATVW